jgi:hypothetical protein
VSGVDTEERRYDDATTRRRVNAPCGIQIGVAFVRNEVIKPGRNGDGGGGGGGADLRSIQASTV